MYSVIYSLKKNQIFFILFLYVYFSSGIGTQYSTYQCNIIWPYVLAYVQGLKLHIFLSQIYDNWYTIKGKTFLSLKRIDTVEL